MAEIPLIIEAYEKYYDTKKKYPLLNDEDVKELIIRIKNGDEEAKEIFIKSNLGLIRFVIERYFYKSLVPYEDLFQEGFFGLERAVMNYDVNKNIKFSTYGVKGIRMAISRSIEQNQSNIRIPVHLQAQYFKYQKLLESNPDLSDDEIMDILDINSMTLNSLKNFSNYYTSSLNNNIDKDKEREVSEFIGFEDAGYEEFESNMDDKTFLLMLRELLLPFEYYIYYYRIYENPPKTLEEISNDFGVSRERVRQHEGKVLNKIKAKMPNVHKIELEIANIIKKYGLSKITEMSIKPKSLNDINLLVILKKNLSPFEYFIIYKMYFDGKKRTLTDMVNLTSLDEEEIIKIIKSIKENYQKLFEMYSNKSLPFNNPFSSIKQYYEQDLEPNYDTHSISDIYQELKKYSADELRKKYPQLMLQYSHKDLMQIEKYFGFRKVVTPEDVHDAEKEINLKLMGFSLSYYLPFSLLSKSYMENIHRFNDYQKDIIDAAFIGRMSKEEFRNKHRKNYAYVLNHMTPYISEKLERIYFGLDNFFWTSLTREQVILIMNNPNYVINEEEKYLMSLFFGIGCKKHSILEIAAIINSDYTKTHDRINNIHDKFIKLNLSMTSYHQKVNSEYYVSFITNPQYPLPTSTRELLKDYLINGMSYKELEHKYHLKNEQVSNRIKDGLRKLDDYRFKLKTPLLFSRKEYEQYYRVSRAKYTSLQKELIYKRYFEGKMGSELLNEYDIPYSFINDTFQTFERSMTRFLYRNKITKDDYIKELEYDESFSVLTDCEREYLLLIEQGKSRNEIMAKLKISINVYHHLKEEISYKIMRRKAGTLVPKYCEISHDLIEKYLNDPRLPLSKRDQDLIKHILGICGFEKLSEEEIQKKYGFAKKLNVYRMFKRSIIIIMKFHNREIEPTISYDDVIQLKRYFPLYEQKILEYLYKDGLSYKDISEILNKNYFQIANICQRIKTNLIAIMNNDALAKKYDFSYARNVLHNVDLPLYGNSELAIQLYEMYFGENGQCPLNATQLVQHLKGEYKQSTIIHSIYSVMIAVCKYQMGIRKEKAFTREELEEYMANNIVSKNERNQIEKYFVKSTHGEINRKKGYLNSDLYYKICEYFNCLSFNIKTDDLEKIYNDPSLFLSKKTRNVLRSMLGEGYADKNGKEFVKTLKLLKPVYLALINEKKLEHINE